MAQIFVVLNFLLVLLVLAVIGVGLLLDAGIFFAYYKADYKADKEC
jgi:hypothetical protein